MSSAPPLVAAAFAPAARREHERQLLLRRRCAACAEPVEPGVVLRGTPCPHCGTATRWLTDAAEADRLDALTLAWRRRRPWLYGLVGVGAFLSGPLPLAGTAVTLAGLLAARYTVLRSALVWFSPRRRAVVRFGLRLYLVVVALGSLVLHELLTLLPGVHMPLKALVALAGLAAFVEGALAILRDRLRRDLRSPELDAWEWLLPLGLLAGLVAGCVLAVAVLLYALAALDSVFAWLADRLGGLFADGGAP